MNAPVQIRNPEVVEDIRKLAAQMHVPLTEAVARAVKAEVLRLESARAAELEAKRKAVNEIVERFNSRPIIGPDLTDDDLYDELGLPK